jgi:hypothetical protein
MLLGKTNETMSGWMITSQELDNESERLKSFSLVVDFVILRDKLPCSI